MAEAAIIGQRPIDNFVREGFNGMRRHAINQFAKRFFFYHMGKDEDGNPVKIPNPNGTIDPFPVDMEKPQLDTMMENYHALGKFGDDPFNQQPKDDVAELRQKLDALIEKYEGPKANPATETFNTPTPVPKPEFTELNRELKVQFGHADLDAMEWNAFRKKAKDMGIETYGKTRVIITAEIEAKEAE